MIALVARKVVGVFSFVMAILELVMTLFNELHKLIYKRVIS